jgi:hypothetical protein
MALSHARRDTLWAVAQRVLVNASPDRDSVLADCERTLAAQKLEARLGLPVLLWLLRWVPVLMHGARFESLDPSRQDAVLHRLEQSSLTPLRAGFWGLRTLIFLAHYGRPELSRSIGYAPVEDGNAEILRRRA